MENAARKRGPCVSREEAVHLASRIVGVFEDLLDKNEMSIPCPDGSCVPIDERRRLEGVVARILMDGSRGE